MGVKGEGGVCSISNCIRRLEPKVHLKGPFLIEIAAASYLRWTAINFDW